MYFAFVLYFEDITAHLTVWMFRDSTVNAAIRNLRGNKDSEEEEEEDPTHSREEKCLSDFSLNTGQYFGGQCMR